MIEISFEEWHLSHKNRGILEILLSKRGGWDTRESMYRYTDAWNRIPRLGAFGTYHAPPNARSSDTVHTDVVRVCRPTVTFNIRLGGLHRHGGQEVGIDIVNLFGILTWIGMY